MMTPTGKPPFECMDWTQWGPRMHMSEADWNKLPWNGSNIQIGGTYRLVYIHGKHLIATYDQDPRFTVPRSRKTLHYVEFTKPKSLGRKHDGIS